MVVSITEHQAPFGTYIEVAAPNVSYQLSVTGNRVYTGPVSDPDVLDALQREGYEPIKGSHN